MANPSVSAGDVSEFKSEESLIYVFYEDNELCQATLKRNGFKMLALYGRVRSRSTCTYVLTLQLVSVNPLLGDSDGVPIQLF